MELTGQRVLQIDRNTAWSALNDPAILKASIPGCESIEKTGENEYAIAVATALGPVRAKFRGRLRLEDVVAPQSYTLKFEGEGGAAGFAKGQSRVSLSEEGGMTTLDYTVSAQVGGRIAQVGNRLIDSAAKKLADDFFAAFEKTVSGTISPRQPAPETVPGTISPAAAEKVPTPRVVAIGFILAALVASVAYTLR
jgi:carbon monoxide dehydrogenase subunit G